MISPGDILSLNIEKPAAGGRMIARSDRLVVLVSGAIPGERVRAVVERVGKGVAYAAAKHVDEPSPDRRQVTADPMCGGCLFAHIAYARQLDIKSLVIADAFARIGRIELPRVQVAPSPENGYRMRARLHLRGARVGFYLEGTHEVCNARQTGQLLLESSDALERLAAAMASLGIDTIREIEVAENVDASQRVVALDGGAPVDGPTLDRLAGTEGFTGVWTPQAARGDAWVTDIMSVSGQPPVRLRRHVLAFFQGNRFLFNDLASHVLDEVPMDGDVLDLYAGVGLFAVAAAATRGARVVAVEGDRVAALDLTANAGASKAAVRAVHQSVERFIGAGESARRGVRGGSATVIVDPPRTGVSREALDGVLDMRAPKIIYVSCDVATLARDARRLVDGGYAIVRVKAFDLFPNTPHVETVVTFER